MSRATARFLSDTRAASELVGYALLVGMVFLGAWLVIVFGGSLVEEVRNDNAQESAELVIQELDAKFGTLAQLSDVTRIRFDLGGTSPKDLAVSRQGEINVTVNRNVSVTGTAPDCQTEVALTSLRHEQNNQLTAYEAGGVWQGRPSEGTRMITNPDVTFRNGSVGITVVNISGQISESYNEAILDVNSSRDQTLTRTEILRSGECVRPDNVTLKVQSDFYRAWGDYLESEFGHARMFEANRTALVFLEQEELPEETNDAINNVVNLSINSPPAYMTAGAATGAEIDASTGDGEPAHLVVDKQDDNNVYNVQITPLSNGTYTIANRTTVSKTATEEGEDSDIVFVIDRSGSMNDGVTGCQVYATCNRLTAAQEAAAGSLTVLNDTDRVAMVSYNASSSVWTHDLPPGPIPTETLATSYAGDPISTPPTDGLNESIDDLSPTGGTCINCALNEALGVLSVTSNQTRNRSIILLTDGRNSAVPANDPDTLEAARVAGRRGVQINTVAFGECSGSDPDDDLDGFNGTGCDPDVSLLKDVAGASGGDFRYAADPAELREFFENKVQQPVTADQVRLTGATTNASVAQASGGSQPYPPFIAGDTDDMGSAGQFPNINDPTAPSVFKHSFSVPDERKVYLNATWYGCEDWQTVPLSRNNQEVARCTDLNENNPHNITDENITVYTDGDLVGIDVDGGSDPGGNGDDSLWTSVTGNAGAPLLNESAAPWQQNTTQQLEPVIERDSSPSTHDEIVLNLSSNEAIVVYNYSVSGEDNAEWNRLAMLYEIGRSEAEARPEGIINVRIRNARIAEPN